MMTDPVLLILIPLNNYHVKPRNEMVHKRNTGVKHTRQMSALRNNDSNTQVLALIASHESHCILPCFMKLFSRTVPALTTNGERNMENVADPVVFAGGCYILYFRF